MRVCILYLCQEARDLSIGTGHVILKASILDSSSLDHDVSQPLVTRDIAAHAEVVKDLQLSISSLIGLVGGGMVYGVAKTMIDFVIANSFLTNIIVLLLAIVIIRLKPNGIFSRKSR